MTHDALAMSVALKWAHDPEVQAQIVRAEQKAPSNVSASDVMVAFKSSADTLMSEKDSEAFLMTVSYLIAALKITNEERKQKEI